MNIIHANNIVEYLQHNSHVIFFIHSKESADALLDALTEANCHWSYGSLPREIELFIPGGVRVKEKQLKRGHINDYNTLREYKDLPRFRVVL